MKHLFVTILLIVQYQLVCGQTAPGHRLLRTDSKSHLYYVDLENGGANVFVMGRFWDKGGTGYTITGTDTLQRQPDSSYSGKAFRIILKEEALYLVDKSAKHRHFRLLADRDSNLVNNRLNEACYLGRYLDLSRELDKAFPLNNFSFREAFLTWPRLPEHEKNMPYLPFRTFADNRFKQLKDSIYAVQQICTKLVNYMVQHIDTLSYATLKDSLIRLAEVHADPSRYYSVVIDTVALRQPAYFFRLAEDLPGHKHTIFSNGIYNKQAISGLANVEGHDATKKEFLAERKAMKRMTYQAFGSSILGYGLIAALFIVLL